MKPPPTPADFLAEAWRLYVTRAKADSLYATPLFLRRLRHRHTHLGRDVYVELMPDLVLRVRDPQTGDVLAQSKPGQIDQPDEVAPAHQEIMRAAWRNVWPMRQIHEPVADHARAENRNPTGQKP